MERGFYNLNGVFACIRLHLFGCNRPMAIRTSPDRVERTGSGNEFSLSGSGLRCVSDMINGRL